MSFDAESARKLIEEARRRVSLRQTSTYSPHQPTPRQAAFLELEADEALYGGSAGGGKSDAILMAALQYVDVPGYAAILFRRTFTDLALPGALMDRAESWLRKTPARWSERDKRWTFPSGATLSFGYMVTEADKYRYQSSEFQFIGFDELTQFTESQYTYMTSRLRRPIGFPVRPRARAASNPGGTGHDWVHARFVEPTTAQYPFVPAKLSDNPHIDEADYRGRLSKLDATTRAQLLDGLWIRDSQGLIYPYGEQNLVEELGDVGDETRFGLGVDFGASESTPTTSFVVGAWHLRKPEFLVVQSELHAGMHPAKIARRIRELEETFPFELLVGDAGALGKGYVLEFRKEHGIPMREAKKADKLGYRKLLRGALENGEVRIVRGQNDPLLFEMRKLIWNEAGTDSMKGLADHCTDALLYLWRAASAYAHEPPEEKRLRPGDPGYAEQEAKEWLERDIESARRKKDRAWWEP